MALYPKVPLQRLLQAGKPGRRVIAIDFYFNQVGVAISDPDLRVASPYTVYNIEDMRTHVKDMRTMIKHRSVDGMLVSMLLNSHGQDETFANTQRRMWLKKLVFGGVTVPTCLLPSCFGYNIHHKLPIPPVMPSAYTREFIDKFSSLHMLQSFLNELRELPPTFTPTSSTTNTSSSSSTNPLEHLHATIGVPPTPKSHQQQQQQQQLADFKSIPCFGSSFCVPPPVWTLERPPRTDSKHSHMRHSSINKIKIKDRLALNRKLEKERKKRRQAAEAEMAAAALDDEGGDWGEEDGEWEGEGEEEGAQEAAQ